MQFIDLTQESNKRKLDVIDLDSDKESVSSHYRSSDEDEVVIVEEQKELICFGVVESIIKNIQIETINREFHQGAKEIPVIFAPFIDRRAIRFNVFDTSHNMLGELDYSMAALFGPLIGLGIEFQAYLPKVHFVVI